MKYRIVDDATSNEYSATSVETALNQFTRRYDTAEMADGDTFEARVYAGDDLRDLVAVATIVADGKSGIKSFSHSLR